MKIQPFCPMVEMWFQYSLLVFSHLALASEVNYVFNIQNANVAPDGFSRPAVLVNGVFPGTPILANKSDILHIQVNNQLTNPTMRRSTAVHWHGLFQMRTASEDGAAGVTQCPIAPAHSYTYDIPLNNQPGTFWYHSHLSSQYVDGLRGALIVYDPEDPHKSLYDEDNASTIIVLADWYHKAAPGIQDKYLHGGSGNHEPIPDCGTINGKGRYVGGPTIQRSHINVVAGKRYRFRVINASAYGFFTFSIEGHPLKIIEVDGINHQPLTVDRFDIYAGQRYSIVVEANKAVKNYWIRAPMQMQHASDNDNLDGNNVFAVLHYDGAPDAEPTTSPGSGGDVLLREHLLVPLENPGSPGGSAPADKVIDLKFERDKEDDTLEWTVNGIRYEVPKTPTMVSLLNNQPPSRSENAIFIKHNDIVEVRIHGSANGHVHPFHLHGHAFDVIKGISGSLNYVNPPRRDVVGVKGSEVRIRFRADNPGPWYLHCHLDWHLEAGLAVVFAEAPETFTSGPLSQIIKPEWQQLCAIYDALPPELQ